ncbi:hypothetical protein UAJ10_25240 [Nitrospirillum sp. BR 11164]|uniref:hypothetical protein n=1 Tax=Nitrospirillum sp. BR 11164 TaxID=3104324 RepID=UPI002AFF2A68|nr:hypothetical protein [Nitrospirillum sp. BR 11164]MEA1652301.1 hypothetical protein [Nitrospirillum sp. BR 11164]
MTKQINHWVRRLLPARLLPTLGVLLPIAACSGAPDHDYVQVADENPAFSSCSQSAFDLYPGAEQGALRADHLNACLATHQTYANDQLAVARIHSF